LLEIVRPLDREIDAVHALHHPATRLTLLLRALQLRDVDHDATQPRGPVTVEHNTDVVADPHDPTVSGDHAVLGGAGSLVSRDPLAVVGMEMILPEGGIGQPAVAPIAEDPFGLAVHEREL